MWWIVFVTSLVGFGFASQFGLIEQMWVLDISKISSFIISLYILFSIVCGWTAWHVNRKNIDRIISIEWFASNNFIRLGLIGTVIGFILAFSELIVPTGSFSISDIKSLIQVIAEGIAVAFITTLVGLICSTFLQIQIVVIEHFKND